MLSNVFSTDIITTLVVQQFPGHPHRLKSRREHPGHQAGRSRPRRPRAEANPGHPRPNRPGIEPDPRRHGAPRPGFQRIAIRGDPDGVIREHVNRDIGGLEINLVFYEQNSILVGIDCRFRLLF